MALRMVALVRAKDGSWFARKGIPVDVRWRSREAHLRLPKDTPHHEAKTRCAERIDQQLLSIRCCLMRPIVPLFNSDRERCAALAEQLSRSPGGNLSLPEKIFLRLGFPVERLPSFVRRTSVWCAVAVERLVRKYGKGTTELDGAKWWSPLLTHQGVYLLPFLLQSVPLVGRKLIYRLVVSGDDTSRMIGAWHVFRRSFQDAKYAPLADVLAGDGVIYRRLVADTTAHAVTVDEYRYRAEKVLRSSFNDDDKQVRDQAADAFRNVKPDEFVRYKELATQ